MSTSMTNKSYGNKYRQLHYGDIRLVPVDNGVHPYDGEAYVDAWHVPGQQIVTTQELVRLATKRGITVRLTETSRDGRTTIRLN